MKHILFLAIIISFLVSCISDITSKKTSENDITINAYLNNLGENNNFPFQITLNQNLPKLSNASEVNVFSNTVINNEAYFYEMSKHQVQKVNISNGQVLGSISFSNLPENTDLKYAYLEADFNVWYIDTTLYVFNSSGQYIKTIHLPLHYQGKDFVINTSSKTPFQYFNNNTTLIIPLNCISEYESSEVYNLPQFAAYNVNSGQLDYLPIYMPENYPPNKYLGELSEPYTAKEENYFFCIYPLNNQVYKFDVSTKTLQNIPLQLPVALSSATMIDEPLTIEQMANLKYFSNHIAGMAVAIGKIFIQQTDIWNKQLSSKKYVDNTIFYSFDENGQIVWQGAFPKDIFDEIGIFSLDFAQNGRLFFTSFNQNNDRKIIQLSSQF